MVHIKKKKKYSNSFSVEMKKKKKTAEVPRWLLLSKLSFTIQDS